MIRRRTLLGTAAILAAPALVSHTGAQSAFDWTRFKGQKINVSYPKFPRGDVWQAHEKEFQQLTGITVSSEQIPEQQQRVKMALELASGNPSFDAVYVALHVQKRLIEKGRWMADLRPMLADPTLTSPDFDFADFSAASVKASSGSDGKLNVIPMNQEQSILFYNKQMFAEAGLEVPRTLDALLSSARKLTSPSKGIYGFVGRGLKNANVVLYDNFLLGWDQETISADGTKLLTDTPAAIEAGKYFQTLMRETAPPGVIQFNWYEAQTSFMQGAAATWWDSIGSSAPVIDPTKSRIVGKAGFAPVPAGPKGAWSCTFMEGIGIPAAAKNKGPAWLYCQWAAGKMMMNEIFRLGAGTPPRNSPYRNADIRKGSAFPAEWFDTAVESLRIARSSLPEIVAVTEFRDTLGIALSNIIGGADVATELHAATAAFAPVLAKELQS